MCYLGRYPHGRHRNPLVVFELSQPVLPCILVSDRVTETSDPLLDILRRVSLSKRNVLLGILNIISLRNLYSKAAIASMAQHTSHHPKPIHSNCPSPLTNASQEHEQVPSTPSHLYISSTCLPVLDEAKLDTAIGPRVACMPAM